MTNKGASSQACAACKYQRRRCNPDCPLAPYFPADKPKTFQNVHRLFGVSNIMKILKQVTDDQKDEAMKSIIYEADIRERFPVHGCSFVIYQLKEQLAQCQQELYHVNSLLATFRSKEHQFQPGNLGSSHDVEFPAVPNEVGCIELRDIKPAIWIQPPSQSHIGHTLSNNCSIGVNSHDFDGTEFDTIRDDRRVRPRYEVKEACEPSHESTLNDNIKSMDVVSPSHELKLAAACFSLRSIHLGKIVSR